MTAMPEGTFENQAVASFLILQPVPTPSGSRSQNWTSRPTQK